MNITGIEDRYMYIMQTPYQIVNESELDDYIDSNPNNICQIDYETHNESFIWIASINESFISLNDCLSSNIIEYNDYCIVSMVYDQAVDLDGLETECIDQNTDASAMPIPFDARYLDILNIEVVYNLIWSPILAFILILYLVNGLGLILNYQQVFD